MKLLTIVGARPQFIKAAMISRAIAAHNLEGASPRIVEEIIHTGQHYDRNMSDIFFQQMHIPEPVVNLEAGTGMHGAMTARMLAQIEAEVVKRQPDCVLVYGDTNSTLAGALAAAKLHVPVAHVEAGLRSFNRRMPEEINRVLADHVSHLLFCPTHAAVQNLAREGITQGVHHVGDVMYDAALAFSQIADRESKILSELGVEAQKFLLATIHRAENTDDPQRMRNIMRALQTLADTETVIFPMHPRTRSRLNDLPSRTPELRIIDPVSFLDMVQLERHARVILTDSGGVQKEAYFHGVPCVTLREETEWVETVDSGWNKLVGADTGQILMAVCEARPGRPIDEYGQGMAAMEILEHFKLGG